MDLKNSYNLKISNSRGSILIQVIMGMFILTLMSLGMLSMIETSMRARSLIDIKMMLDNIRTEAFKNITSKDSRLQTENNHLNFIKTCDPVAPPAVPPEGCSDLYEGVVKYFDNYGEVYNDSTDATSGFNIQGFPCTTFDSLAGNDACPFRMEIRWRAACVPTAAAGTCPKPKMFYLVKFHYKPFKKTLPLNIVRYNFDQMLVTTASTTEGPATDEESCTRLSGTWVTPAAPRPPFCAMSDSIIEWY